MHIVSLIINEVFLKQGGSYTIEPPQHCIGVMISEPGEVVVVMVVVVVGGGGGLKIS